MTYIRGDEAQFNAWELLGNKGWGWDVMLQHYKSVEKLFAPSKQQVAVGASVEDQYHGFDGGLHVGFNPALQTGSLFSTMQKSWDALHQPWNKDPNSGNTAGFAVWPQTLDPEKNQRWDAATAFYWPIAGRKNLKLINGTATRVTWNHDGHTPRATGVEYTAANNGGVKTVTANKEVILSAGALRTPLVLERSGVGSSALLKKLGIPLVVDSPGVGENMIDQPNTALIYAAKDNYTGYTPYATFATAKDLFGDSYDSVKKTTRGNLASWAAANKALNASALQHIFEIQHDVIFRDGTTMAEILPAASGANLAAVFWGLLPFSRGSVHTGTDDKPVIDPRYLSVDFDVDATVAAGRLCTSFWNTNPAKSLVKAQVSPNSTVLPAKATDEQWRAFLAGATNSNSHSIGTAAMMARELGGVVDDQLRVYGTQGLRVVDASVMPMQFSGHLTATIYAVADRAAQLITHG